MARATTPEIDVRWEMANYAKPRRGNDGVSLEATDQHAAVNEGLEDLAAMLIPDGAS